MAMYKFPVVLERGETNYGIYPPDLPGCISLGHTPQEALENVQEAIQMHLEGMVEDGDAIPEPSPVSRVQFDPATESVHEVEVDVCASTRQ